MGNEGSVFEGKTRDGAIRKGLESLGLTRAEVSISVVEEGGGGFLGLGARPWRVSVSERPGGAIESGGRERGRGGRGRRSEGEGRQRRNGAARGGRGRSDGRGRGEGRREGRSEGRREGRSDSRREGRGGSRREGRSDTPREVRSDSRREGPKDRSREGRGDNPREGRGDGRRREQPVQAESPTPREPQEVRAAGDDSERRRRRGRRGGRRRREREGERRPAEAASVGPAVAEMPEATHESSAAAVEPTTQTATIAEVSVNANELAANGKQCTEDLLHAMGFKADVTATADEDRVDVGVSIHENEDLLTGPKGEVRQALQHLLNLMLNRGGGTRYHLQLEINDFWEKRENELRDLAQSLATDALENQTEAMTEYLNSQERRIIHMTLRDDERVKTYALGTGLIKRVAVAPADFPEPQY